jgi:hypothetical protein
MAGKMAPFKVRHHVKLERCPYPSVRASMVKPGRIMCAVDVESVSKVLDQGLIGVGMVGYDPETDEMLLPFHIKIDTPTSDEDEYTMKFWNDNPENQETLAWYRAGAQKPYHAALALHAHMRSFASLGKKVQGITDNGPYDFPKVDAFVGSYVREFDTTRFTINNGLYLSVLVIDDRRKGLFEGLGVFVEQDVIKNLQTSHDAFVKDVQRAYLAEYARQTNDYDPAVVHSALYDAVGHCASYIWCAGNPA